MGLCSVLKFSILFDLLDEKSRPVNVSLLNRGNFSTSVQILVAGGYLYIKYTLHAQKYRPAIKVVLLLEK